MSDEIAIKIEGLGKRYQLGQTVDLQRNIRETLMTLPRFFGRKATKAGRRLAQRLERRAKLSHLEGELGDQTPDPDTPRGSFWALRDIDLEVKRGEALGIIGRNGAGKSTLLKILSRVTAPTRGRAEMHGRVGSLLEVGTGFNPELTGRENTYLNGSILGMSKREIAQKFDEIVDFSGVEKFIDTPVKRYSSGMRVRLGFAVAAHLETEILIVDEVLAVGDLDFRKKCLGKMQSSASSGRTVLFVSHNMSSIKGLCSRAVLLDRGRIVTTGNVCEVVDAYVRHGVRRAGERVWADPALAPGNDFARLKRIALRNADDEITTRFDVTEPVIIDVDFTVTKEQYPIRTGLFFYSDSTTPVFVSFDNVDSPWTGQRLPAGEYRSTCQIQGNLLNEGTFSIMPTLASNPGGLHASESDALTFHVEDRMEPSGVRGNLAVPWPNAVMRPRLPWNVKRLS